MLLLLGVPGFLAFHTPGSARLPRSYALNEATSSRSRNQWLHTWLQTIGSSLRGGREGTDHRESSPGNMTLGRAWGGSFGCAGVLHIALETRSNPHVGRIRNRPDDAPARAPQQQRLNVR